MDSKLFGAKNANSSVEDLGSTKSKSLDFDKKSETYENTKNVSGFKQRNVVFTSFSLFSLLRKIGTALKFCFKGLMFLTTKILKNFGFFIVLILAIVVFLNFENLFFKVFGKKELKLQQTAIIIEESKKIAKLFTVSYYSEIVLDTNKVLYDTSNNYTNMMTNLFHDDELQKKSYDVDSSLYELIIIANGTGYAGNDLSKITKQDIIISDTSFTINIKSAEVLGTVVNPSDFTVFLDEGKWSADEVQAVKSIAVKKIENYALENGVLEKANTRTKEMLTEFLKSIGHKNIIINFKN